MGIIKSFVSDLGSNRYSKYQSIIDTLGLVNVVGRDYHKNEIIKALTGRTFDGNFHDIPVKLQEEPKNEHDKNAIKVMARDLTGEWQHIGYIPSDLCVTIKDLLRSPAMYRMIYKGNGNYADTTFRVVFYI